MNDGTYAEAAGKEEFDVVRQCAGHREPKWLCVHGELTSPNCVIIYFSPNVFYFNFLE